MRRQLSARCRGSRGQHPGPHPGQDPQRAASTACTERNASQDRAHHPRGDRDSSLRTSRFAPAAADRPPARRLASGTVRPNEGKSDVAATARQGSRQVADPGAVGRARRGVCLGSLLTGRWPRRGQPAALARQSTPGRAGRGEHRGPVRDTRPGHHQGGSSMTAVLESRGLGKRYRQLQALTDCTLSIPAGHIVGLVGPNGAGKTTLLNLAVGMLAPTSGTIEVLGGKPASGPAQLAKVGFVAQDTPTYAGFTVADHLKLGAHLNPGWDAALARDRIGGLGLGPGQRAQLALPLAIAKKPELLILDEPIASLDPLARREFLQSLTEFTAGHQVSVVMSSHLVGDLERVCDYLIVLVTSRVQVAGQVGELLASHRQLTGARLDPASLPADWRGISAGHARRASTLAGRP